MTPWMNQKENQRNLNSSSTFRPDEPIGSWFGNSISRFAWKKQPEETQARVAQGLASIATRLLETKIILGAAVLDDVLALLLLAVASTLRDAIRDIRSLFCRARRQCTNGSG